MILSGVTLMHYLVRYDIECYGVTFDLVRGIPSGVTWMLCLVRCDIDTLYQLWHGCFISLGVTWMNCLVGCDNDALSRRM